MRGGGWAQTANYRGPLILKRPPSPSPR
jgi:hypothetical protein